MPSTFLYPSNYQLSLVDQQFFPTLSFLDPVFQYFPVEPVDSHVVRWEQKDNYLGLAQVRGLNGDPPRVRRVGGKTYTMEPGVYGEFTQVDEAEITVRRQWGSFATPIDTGDLVLECQNQLRARQVARVRKVLWDIMVYGSFSVLDARGVVAHQDAYSQRKWTATVAWSTVATSTPLADFRAVQLLGRGYSTTFGLGSTAFMNQQTANYMLSNTNAADLYGRRSAGLSTLNTLQLVNQLYAGEGLPEIRVFDDHYIDDSSVVQLFIPDNYVVVVGRRVNGTQLGRFALTRNANATPIGAPASYTLVTESERPPKTITVDYGFNGGPEIWYPGSVIVMYVG